MSKKDYGKLALEAHKKSKGKVAIAPKMPLDTTEDLSIAYTPGVAEPCLAIAKNVETAYDYTSKGNTVAVVSDGSAVLGLGNIGPEASLPVMEGKAVLFKKFADVDAVAVVLDTQDTEEIIATVKAIAPTYGGINLEDISAPRCFEIERRLKEELSIPVMHDDQHGTAIVTVAGMINALKVVGKSFSDLRIVVNGAGAAGVAVVKLLQVFGVQELIMCDSKGIIHKNRTDLNAIKQEMAELTNSGLLDGSLADAVAGSDVFIGVSAPGVLTQDMVKTMNSDAIIFAMANPIPEIYPDEAKAAGARVVATGRSDFPNQVNNVLAFPGIFRGALDARAKTLTTEMYAEVAKAIASCIDEPSENFIIPGPFDERIPQLVASAIQHSSTVS